MKRSCGLLLQASAPFTGECHSLPDACARQMITDWQGPVLMIECAVQTCVAVSHWMWNKDQSLQCKKTFQMCLILAIAEQKRQLTRDDRGAPCGRPSRVSCTRSCARAHPAQKNADPCPTPAQTDDQRLVLIIARELQACMVVILAMFSKENTDDDNLINCRKT